MARLFQFFLFILLIAISVYVFVYVDQLDKQPENTEVLDLDVVKSFGDSLALVNAEDSLPKTQQSPFIAAYEDFTISVQESKIEVEKSHTRIYYQNIALNKVNTVLATDLNGNQQPEFWVAGYEGKSYRIYAFEYKAGKLETVRFPAIMGRQRLGYAGKDSLYLEKSAIVHAFQYENDPYADIAQGIRKCYYKYGVDRSFVLSKTLDLDKQDE